MAGLRVRACRRFVFHFANDHLDFRIAEIQSIADLFKVELPNGWENQSLKNPFWVFNLKSHEDAEKLASRSVLIKSVIELWGQGETYEAMYQNVKESMSHDDMMPYCSKESSFKVKVETYNKTVTQQYKVKRIEDLPQDIFPLEGKVNLKNPNHVFYILENYGEDHNSAPDQPYQVYFGRWIVDGQREKTRRFTLKDRCFLGHTSMDTCLSFVMANMGQAHTNRLVFDPFVGTGSLLVSAAECGSYVLGTDIDFILLHAKGKPSRAKQKKRSKDESIRNNLAQYGLQNYYLDAVVADASKPDMWCDRLSLDAIITDPPYGIREGAKKLGSDKDSISLTEEDQHGHIPQTTDYKMTDIFKDLLNFAARFLKLHGRLVYWLPVYVPEYCEENIPQHPCLKLLSNCEQKLNSKVSRRLITMEKVKVIEKIKHTQDSAHVVVDHFKDSSFREKYFNKGSDTVTKINVDCQSRKRTMCTNSESDRTNYVSNSK